MSKLRPETHTSLNPSVSDGTAYLMILSAVRAQSGLIHGRLHHRGEHCAIGSFFAVNPRVSLPMSLIDEVAAVNDSVPTLTEKQRKAHVAKWLRWKLEQVGLLKPRKAKAA